MIGLETGKIRANLPTKTKENKTTKKTYTMISQAVAKMCYLSQPTEIFLRICGIQLD